MHQVSQVSHLLTVLNSSVNFYIYLAKHGKKEIMLSLRSNRTDSAMDLDNTEVGNLRAHFVNIKSKVIYYILAGSESKAGWSGCHKPVVQYSVGAQLTINYLAFCVQLKQNKTNYLFCILFFNLNLLFLLVL